MMNMRPPQQGHGRGNMRGSSAAPLGLREEMEAAKKQIFQMVPNFSLAVRRAGSPIVNERVHEICERGLRMAGIPEDWNAISELDVSFWQSVFLESIWGAERKFLEPLMRFARRREGPYRLIQNRSRTSVVALKSDAAAEKSEDQLSRDLSGCLIFDFCNKICQSATSNRTFMSACGWPKTGRLPSRI